MSYKGGDLDLRTPLGAANPPASSGAAPGGPGSGRLPSSALTRTERTAPIWVDDTVMACCNLAFELATAHRAERVRMEHLLHALALIEPAAEALERRGINVGTLWPETGSLITGIPVLLTTDSRPPGRAPEFEEVLQLASQRAYALRRPTSVVDLIGTLLEGHAHWPSVGVLHRHMRDVTTLVSGSRRERVRVQAVSQPAAEASKPAKGRSASKAKPVPAATPSSNKAAGEFTDELQPEAPPSAPPVPNEGSVVLVGPSGRAHDKNEYEVIRRADGIRAIEAFENKFANIEQALSTVIERIGSFERDLRGKVEADNSRFDAIAAHLTAFEEVLTEPGDDGDEKDKAASPLEPHLTAIASQTSEISNAIEVVRTRLAAIETVAEGQTSGNERLQAVVASLSETLAAERRSIVKAVTEPVERGLAALNSSLIEHHIEDHDALRQIGNRLARTEDSIATLGQQVVEASEHFQQRHAEGMRSVSQIGERLSQTEAGLANLVQQIVKATERVQLQRQSSDNATFTQISERLVQTEASLAKIGQRMVTQAEAGLNILGRQIVDSGSRLERDLEQVHDDLMKINANQQTIATNMDHWRENTLADLGSVGDRLEALERSSFRTAQVVEALALSVQDLHEIAAKAEERRTRITRWLFGPDVITAPAWRPLAGQARALPHEENGARSEGGALPWLNNTLNTLRNALRSK